jgi:UDP-N-acetylmuramate--alanine ligase
VTGTHGKGTVSAMITHGLITAGRDRRSSSADCSTTTAPTRKRARGRAVAEVDESDRSHLNLEPTHVVVNNLEVDHLNFYRDLDDIVGTMAVHR